MEFPRQDRINSYELDYEVNRRLQKEKELTNHLVKAKELVRKENTILLVSEKVISKNLLQFKPRYDMLDKQDVEDFIKMAKQSVRILSLIHKQQVIHQDIKPQNILIDEQTKNIRYIDFGISQIVSLKAPYIPFTGSAQGTFAYMSPEQTGRMDKDVTRRTDIYSLGLTFWQLLLGESPYPKTKSPIELVHCHLAQEPRALPTSTPNAIEAILKKMIKKQPTERYVNAQGILEDFKTLEAYYSEHQSFPEDFKVGEKDIDDQFEIPGKLYGRDKELTQMENTLEKVKQGKPQLMMIAGYSGSGKTALVMELSKRQKGNMVFLSGKFDQYNKGIPYSAIVQAIEKSVKHLMYQDASTIENIKNALKEALKGSGQLLIEIVPELEAIIGEQPELEVITNIQAREERFIETIINYFSVFGQGERMLCLFIDDLQWADIGSIQLLGKVLEASNTNMICIGAYRDNEVDDTHPLVIALQKIEEEGKHIESIITKSLEPQFLEELIQDSTKAKDASTLTKLILKNTSGNVFFSREYLMKLYYDKHLTFNMETKAWEWDIDALNQLTYSDNVVDFMVDALNEMDEDTKNLLKQAACIGASFEMDDLVEVLGKEESEVQQLLFTPIQAGWLLQKQDAIRFLHDRLQQASYRLNSEEEKQATHRKMGEILLVRAKKNDNLDEDIFDVVHHLRQSNIESYANDDQMDEMLSMTVQAANKAIDAAAFTAAAENASYAKSLLPKENRWENKHTHRVYDVLAMSYFGTAKYDEAEIVYKEMLENAKDDITKLEIYDKMVGIYFPTEKYHDCYLTGVAAFKMCPVFDEMPFEGGPDDFIQFCLGKYGEYLPMLEKFLSEHEGRYEALLELPEMKDRKVELTLSILNGVLASFFLDDEANGLITVAAGVIGLYLTLTYGRCFYSSVTLALTGWCMQFFFKNIPVSTAMMDVAFDMAKSYGSEQFVGRLYLFRSTMHAFYKDEEIAFNGGKQFTTEAWLRANNCGDHSWGGFSSQHGSTHYYRAGYNFKRLLERFEQVGAYYKKCGNQSTPRLDADVLASVRVLLGLDNEYTSIDPMEGAPTNKLLRLHHSYYYAWTLYHQKRYMEALEQVKIAQEQIVVSLGLIQFQEFFYYAPMILAKAYSEHLPDEVKTQLMEGLDGTMKQLEEFYTQNPVFFKGRYSLVKAEYNRITNGDIQETLKLYEEAIEAGRRSSNAFVYCVGLECCAEYSLERGLPRTVIASLMREAASSWGSFKADMKVTQLSEKYPKYFNDLTVDSGATHGSTATTSFGSATTSGSGSAGLDSATIVKATHAMSETIEFDALIQKLIELVMENAGADNTRLILESRNGYAVEATQSIKDYVKIHVPLEEAKDMLCYKAVDIVLKTKRFFISEDACSNDILSKDPYVIKNNIKSLFVVPILNKGNLVGMVYLENNQIEGAFTQQRIDIMNALLTAVAAQVENARIVKNIMELNVAYERFLPKQFLQQLGQNDVRDINCGDAVKRNISVLFLDIRSFTTITEKLSPKDAFQFVNEFLYYIAPVITRNNGFIDKFIGDAVMALFPNSVDDALCTAKEMIDELEKMNENRRKKGLSNVRIGVGVHTGPVILGTIGDKTRMEATVISDTVNTASRCESLTKRFGVSIICSQAVIDLIENKDKVPEFRCIGSFLLKGKTTSWNLYECMVFNEPSDDFDVGVEYFAKGDFDSAIESFNKVVDQDRLASYMIEAAQLYAKCELPEEWQGEIKMDKDGNPVPIGQMSSASTENLAERLNVLEGENKALLAQIAALKQQSSPYSPAGKRAKNHRFLSPAAAGTSSITPQSPPASPSSRKARNYYRIVWNNESKKYELMEK
mmetsp:Transcript_7477/g.11085  ORF Transcript_7477/g.11085 Transcript_7477/m.11085 type:complete len:1835 (-) Transcript_7477:34-5538(-)